MKIVGSILVVGITACAPAFEDCSFTATFDGTEQKYLLSAPKDVPRPIDVLVSLHGHGSDRMQIREERGECKAARDVADARGMALVSPDYRAKTSWMGPAAEADMLQLLDLLSKRFGGRVFLCGGSMGGTSALTFAARHPEKISGVTAFNPLANHLSYNRFQDAIAASFGGDKRMKEEEYRARSALYFPERFTMPLSVTLGGKDATVLPESARELAASVAALHPGNVYVDDTLVPYGSEDIVRIGDALLGVKLSSGTHTVTLRYRPRGLSTGMKLTGLGMMIVALMVVWKYYLSDILRKKNIRIPLFETGDMWVE